MQNRILASAAASLVLFTGITAGVTHLLARHTPVSSSAQWPESAKVVRSEAGYTLLVFVHPQCDCTQATLNELTQILESAQGRVHTEVLFYEPVNASPGWRTASMVQMAGHIPGVSIKFDVGGEEARRFGVGTSGHALAYTPGGRLAYSGGISGASSVGEESQGRRALTRILMKRAGPRVELEVFGCDLFEERYAVAHAGSARRS